MLTRHDLPIAPSTYWAHKAQPLSDADWDDAQTANAALDVWRANRRVYGADKLAVAMRNAGHDVGRDQVARLMRILGIEGARRGRHRTVTTRRDPAAVRHPDLIRRAWNTPSRPDQWWVADFTYSAQLAGYVQSGGCGMRMACRGRLAVVVGHRPAVAAHNRDGGASRLSSDRFDDKEKLMADRDRLTDGGSC